MWELIANGFKAIAAGGAKKQLGLQSPHTPGAIVRVGRFLYGVTGIWVAISWYVGYANARTPTGSGPHLVLASQPVINSVDRAEVTPGFVSRAGGGSSANTGPTGATGGGARMTVAKIALSQVGASGYIWDEVRPMPRSITTRPFRSDCSGFATDVYKAAGAADPNQANYNGTGDTDTLQEHGTAVGNANIADLAFWGNPDHVAIVVSGGTNPQIVEFGAGPSPIKNDVRNESLYHSDFIGYRSYL
jgi:hypothetical protein